MVSFALLITFLGPAEARAGLYGDFVRWSDEVGESVWGFESNCPRSEVARETNSEPSVCSIATAHVEGAPEAIWNVGLGMAGAEEWLWVTEAIEQRRQDMYANYRHLGFVKNDLERAPEARDPAIQDEIELLEDNLVILGTLEAAHQGVRNRMAHAGPPGQGFAASRARIQGLIREERAIKAAKAEILRQTPLLGHSILEQWIEEVEIYGRLRPNRRDFFYEEVGRAIGNVQGEIQDKLDQYDAITRDEERLGRVVAITSADTELGLRAAEAYRRHVDQVTHDTTLLQELLVSTDPSREPGMENIHYAGCRIENRVLRNQAMGELRGLAFNSAITIATMGLGSGAAGARALRTASGVARLTAVVAAEGVLIAADALALAETSRRCASLRVAAFTGGGSPEAFQECERSLSTQTVMALLGVAGAAVSVRSALRSHRAAIPRIATRAADEGAAVMRTVTAEERTAARRALQERMERRFGDQARRRFPCLF